MSLRLPQDGEKQWIGNHDFSLLADNRCDLRRHTVQIISIGVRRPAACPANQEKGGRCKKKGKGPDEESSLHRAIGSPSSR
ncbi:hypothetical protein [Niveispirillum irakense]|uniref:hypothetical protein n=1 Tax=Niveispirillum irakense TaxID=34011 RepID=UPI0012B5E952|nr:hypothetical protein [Niveispirillum irakense]